MRKTWELITESLNFYVGLKIYIIKFFGVIIVRTLLFDTNIRILERIYLTTSRKLEWLSLKVNFQKDIRSIGRTKNMKWK